ncbi:MAG: ice-binding family protein [Candidatus Binataceae bacterium]
MLYVFDDNEELQECCGCPVTPDQVLTLSVINNLTSNLGVSGADRAAGVIDVISSPLNFAFLEGTVAPRGIGVVSWFGIPTGCDPSGGSSNGSWGTNSGEGTSTAVDPTVGVCASMSHTEAMVPIQAPFTKLITTTSVDLFQNAVLDSTHFSDLTSSCFDLLAKSSGAGACNCAGEGVGVHGGRVRPTPTATPTATAATPTATATAATPTATATAATPTATATATPLAPLLCPSPEPTPGNYAVLAGQSVTTIPTTTINGNLGISPGAAPPGDVTGGPTVTGFTDDGNAAALNGQAIKGAAESAAYAQLATATTISDELGGQTLIPGVYISAATTFEITSGALTLDANGQGSSAVWIFLAESTATSLTTGSGTNIVLENGAAACNVFWQLAGTATLGVSSTFQGSIMASTSITVGNSATVNGRLLADTGSVSLGSSAIGGVIVNGCSCAGEPTP